MTGRAALRAWLARLCYYADNYTPSEQRLSHNPRYHPGRADYIYRRYKDKIEAAISAANNQKKGKQ